MSDRIDSGPMPATATPEELPGRDPEDFAREDADRRTHGRMLLAARRWTELFGFCRSWAVETDDADAFALLLRSVQGLGRVRSLQEAGFGEKRPGTIPPVIVQFWDTEVVPDDIRAAIAGWRERNRGFEHRLFDHARARAFIERAHGERAAAAFDRCPDFATMAGFFRAAYLVAEGGIYVGADRLCARPLAELLGAIRGASFAAPLSGGPTPQVRDGFLAAAPGAPVLKSALADMIDGVERLHGREGQADIRPVNEADILTRAVTRWLAEDPLAGDEAVLLTAGQYRRFATPLDRSGDRASAGDGANGRAEAAISAEALVGRSFRFGRIDGSVIGTLELASGGRIAGYRHPNEHSWSIEVGKLVFRDSDGAPSTIFSPLDAEGDAHAFRGPFLPEGPEPWHTLDEIAGVPAKRIIEELREQLYGGDSPLAHSDARHEDGGYPHTNLVPEIAETVLDVVRPAFWLELGSMLGGSAIRVADLVKRKGAEVDIVCVDPFTGDVNMWAWEQPRRRLGQWPFLRLERGRPSIYDRFLANVAAAGHADIILPIAATSIVGIKLLRRLLEERRISSLPSVIYLDSAHEPDETLLELRNCWALLEPGGVLMGDDWGWSAVRNDVLHFARTVTVNRALGRDLVARHGGFVEEEGGILLDRGQWVIAK